MSQVTPVAPINTEVTEINPVTEKPIEQAPTVNLIRTSKILSILSTIFTWQPANIRVVVQLPQVTNNLDPLFVIRGNPFCGSPLIIDKLNPFSASTGFLQNNLLSVFTPNVTTEGVRVIYYDVPPLIAMLSLMFRKWRGSLKWQLRTVASFVNQGFVVAAPIYGAIQPMQLSTPALRTTDAGYRQPLRIRYGSNTPNAALVNSMIYTDVSNQRHIEMELPYRLPVPWFDQFQHIADSLPPYGTSIGWTDNNDRIRVHTTESFVGIYNKNVINATSSSGTNEVIYELFVSAGEDFEFSDRHILFNMFTGTFGASDGNPNTIQIPISRNRVTNTTTGPGTGYTRYPTDADLVSTMNFDAFNMANFSLQESAGKDVATSFSSLGPKRR